MYFIQFVIVCFFIISDAYWGGGHGGMGGGLGGFHSGYGQQGYGYGQEVCAGARQRQGGMSFQQPMRYNTNDYGGYYYQDPVTVRQQPMQNVLSSTPIQNGNVDYLRLPMTYTRTTQAPAPFKCSYINKRDENVFDQKCIFPQEVLQISCSSRPNDYPVGTTVLTSCKSPEYYSDTGDMILEICKDGKWHSDGKTLTCKVKMMVTQPPVAINPYQDPVTKYVQQPQQTVYQSPTVPYVNPNTVANNNYTKYQQSYQPSNQVLAAPSIAPQNVLQQNNMQPKVADNQQNLQTPYWGYYQQNNSPAVPVGSIMNYPVYTPSTTTTPEPTTTTSTTTTTPKPYIDEIDWRQYANPNIPNVQSDYPPSFYYRPTERKNYGSDKCSPLVANPGVILECLSKSARNSSSGTGYIVSINDCQEPQPVGTEATYKCQMYYEPLTGMTTQYRKCKENGDWTGSDDGFGCKLECGKSNPGGRLPLITFGETTMLGQWPWHVALFIRDRGDMTNSCGGTLISRKAILTASHCVTLHYSSLTRDVNDVRVDLGRYYREKDDPYVQKIEVEKIVTHPAYNPFMFESDIAIIILKEPARIGFHVRPSCFPQSHNAAFDEIQLADGSYATVMAVTNKHASFNES